VAHAIVPGEDAIASRAAQAVAAATDGPAVIVGHQSDKSAKSTKFYLKGTLT